MAKGKSIALLGPGHNSITELQAFIGSQTIEHWPIDRLKESERKLRRHSRRKINSLTRAFANFKIAIPCVVDDEGHLLSGAARLESFRELGLSTIPVIVVSHLTELEGNVPSRVEIRSAGVAV